MREQQGEWRVSINKQKIRRVIISEKEQKEEGSKVEKKVNKGNEGMGGRVASK